MSQTVARTRGSSYDVLAGMTCLRGNACDGRRRKDLPAIPRPRDKR